MEFTRDELFCLENAIAQGGTHREGDPPMSWYQRLQDEGLVIWDGRNFTPSFTITEKGRKAYAEVAAPVGEW